SLGGALAVVAAKLLNADGHTRVSAVYTFGGPRCGGDRFAAAYGNDLAQRTYRFLHGDDIVPTVRPPEVQFHHVGRLLRCRHGDTFDPAAQPDPGPSDEPILRHVVLASLREGFLAAFSLLRAVVATLDGHFEALKLVLPATQPGLIGEAARLLPAGIRDHIPSSY